MPPATLTPVEVPCIRTKLPGPNAKRIIAADERLISPSYTRSYPLVASRGHGIMIEDVDGNEFYDFCAGIAVSQVGAAAVTREELAEALRQAPPVHLEQWLGTAVVPEP